MYTLFTRSSLQPCARKEIKDWPLPSKVRLGRQMQVVGRDMRRNWTNVAQCRICAPGKPQKIFFRDVSKRLGMRLVLLNFCNEWIIGLPWQTAGRLFIQCYPLHSKTFVVYQWASLLGALTWLQNGHTGKYLTEEDTRGWNSIEMPPTSLLSTWMHLWPYRTGPATWP